MPMQLVLLWHRAIRINRENIGLQEKIAFQLARSFCYLTTLYTYCITTRVLIATDQNVRRFEPHFRHLVRTTLQHKKRKTMNSQNIKQVASKYSFKFALINPCHEAKNWRHNFFLGGELKSFQKLASYFLCPASTYFFKNSPTRASFCLLSVFF